MSDLDGLPGSLDLRDPASVDVVRVLGARWPGYQILARQGAGRPLAWYARPWPADGSRYTDTTGSRPWWNGTGAVAEAATAGQLDKLLAEQDG